MNADVIPMKAISGTAHPVSIRVMQIRATARLIPYALRIHGMFLYVPATMKATDTSGTAHPVSTRAIQIRAHQLLMLGLPNALQQDLITIPADAMQGIAGLTENACRIVLRDPLLRVSIRRAVSFGRQRRRTL